MVLSYIQQRRSKLFQQNEMNYTIELTNSRLLKPLLEVVVASGWNWVPFLMLLLLNISTEFPCEFYGLIVSCAWSPPSPHWMLCQISFTFLLPYWIFKDIVFLFTRFRNSHISQSEHPMPPAFFHYLLSSDKYPNTRLQNM